MNPLNGCLVTLGAIVLLHWDMLFNGRVGHHVNGHLLLVVEPSSLSSSSTLRHTSQPTEGQSASASLDRVGIGWQTGMSIPFARS